MFHAAVKKHNGIASNAAELNRNPSATQSHIQSGSSGKGTTLLSLNKPSATQSRGGNLLSSQTGRSQASKFQVPSSRPSSTRPGSSSWSKPAQQQQQQQQSQFNKQPSFKIPQPQEPLHPSSNANNLSKRCHGQDEKFVSALNGASGFTNGFAGSSNQKPVAPPVSSMEKLHQAVYFDENDFDDEINFDDDDDDIIPVPAKPAAIASSSSPLPRVLPAPKFEKFTKQVEDGKTAAAPAPTTFPPSSSQPIPWSSSPPNRRPSAGGLQQPPVPVVSVQVEDEDEVKPRKARKLPWANKESEEPAAPPDSKTNKKSHSKRKIALATPAKPTLNFMNLGGASATKKAKKDNKIKIKGGQRAGYSTVTDFEPASKKLKRTRQNDKNLHGSLQLSPEQKKVLDIIVQEGKSVFFTGSAGTGKSVLLRQIIEELRKKFVKDPERVAVTASTGLAALNIGGVTLHSFAGIGLGKEAVELLVRKVKRSPKSKDRWLKTKVLIIDEVSMVDGELFDKLEAVAREVRRNSRPFGGIQVVVTGDFFQLPPVAESGRISRFAFEAKTWGSTVEHTVALTQIFRQKDPVFAGILNEMRTGQLRDESAALFKALSRTVKYDDGLEATELFPTRNEVEKANRERLSRLPGQTETYLAADTSAEGIDEKFREKLLSNLMCPKTIELRKDAQVMLIKNIDETLVNGSLGKVVGFMNQKDYEVLNHDEFADEEMDSADIHDPKRKELWQKLSAPGGGNKADTAQKFPLVQFRLTNGCYRVYLVSTESWKIESVTGEMQAQRSQIPLILSWALSIHKSQGQTLERVKVDLAKIFEKGQAYVALSRATSKDRLQVLNFQKSRVMVHDKVSAFYRNLQDAHLMGEVRHGMGKSARPDQHAVDLDDDDSEDAFYNEEYGNKSRMSHLQGGIGGSRQPSQSTYF